ncbi:START-2 domain protein [Trifolium pratense]|uniref:START-2 domain protein n=1 Tax=Trifolium pratense TaxID=57577 RepID=A0A2K3PCD1_TRIPR|nr:START-2 domain protein [Trifolium pratense]
MENRKNIVQYRERLDKTLTSFDLTNDQKLKSLVESQFCRSSQSEMELEGYDEKLEIKTAELSNCLDMMRSVSADENGGSSTSHADWKLKQDNEEFRVMYREGPEGTPYHTMMIEGYVDAPVDVSLCLTWESPLYKKWWPQFTVPTFKVTASDCLQKVQTGEQIALVRMKPPWPLSTREAIVHYYVFEYFQDDLIVVLLKTVTELEKINETIDGLKNDVIPEAKGAVRIDVLGGIVMQKVTSERSYIRAIANLDIKIDFMPPSLINFIARQIIGSGFRLFQKAVASKMNGNREFSKALTDLLYVRIREALYSTDESNAMDEKELKQVASILPAEEQDRAIDMSREDKSNQNANNDASSEDVVKSKEDVTIVHDIPIEEGDTSIALKGNVNCEIVDADSEEIVEENIEEMVEIEKDVKKVNGISDEEGDTSIVVKGNKNYEIVDANSEEIVEANIEDIVQIEKDFNKENGISIEHDDTKNVLKRKSSVNISSNVRQALETLERAISSVRKYGFHSRRFSFSFANEATICKEKGGEFDPHSAKLFQPPVKNDVSVEEPSNNIPRENSDDLYEIQNFRCV